MKEASLTGQAKPPRRAGRAGGVKRGPVDFVVSLSVAEAKSTLTRRTPFGPRGRVWLPFIWHISVSFTQTRSAVWSSLGRALDTSTHARAGDLSLKQLPLGRIWGNKCKFLVVKAHTFHADSLLSWAFCSGVTHIDFPWTPSNDFGILVLVFLNPNAEFQLWAHQLSPDYVLSACQASFLI